MTPPQTLLMTCATAPLPWMTLEMPGYFTFEAFMVTNPIKGKRGKEPAAKKTT